MEKYVYRISHLNPKNDDVKGIATFFTKKEAEELVALYKTYNGFKDSPEGFFIQRYSIDEEHWKSGYVTVKHKISAYEKKQRYYR